MTQSDGVERVEGVLHPEPLLVPIASLRGSHVAIATPCYGNAFTSQYVASILRTQTRFGELGLAITTLLGAGASIERARNQLVAQFLSDPALTHMLFIDADEGWQPDAVIRLLATGHDMVGVPVHKKVDKPGAWNLNLISNGPLTIERGAFEVASIGTGFLMISRVALEKMIDHYPELKIDDKESPNGDHLYALFGRTLTNGRDLSEDFSFCLRWRVMGGRIWADPDSVIDHVGTREWSQKFSDVFETVEESNSHTENSG